MDIVEAIEQARVLIQEAKGIAEPHESGPVTDRLDFAEHWLGKAKASHAALKVEHEAEVEAIIADAATYCWMRYKQRPPAFLHSECVFTSHEHQKIAEALRAEIAKRAVTKPAVE